MHQKPNPAITTFVYSLTDKKANVKAHPIYQVDLNLVPLFLVDHHPENPNCTIKFILKLQFNVKYQKFTILDLNHFLNSENPELTTLCQKSSLPFDWSDLSSQAQTILTQFKKLVHKYKKVAIKNGCEVHISNDQFDLWFAFLATHNAPFFFENEKNWCVVDYQTKPKNVEFTLKTKVSANNKNKFTCKTLSKTAWYLYETNKKSYLFVQQPLEYKLTIYRLEKSLSLDAKMVISKVNQSLTKNQFFAFYLAWQKLFANYERNIPSVFITRYHIDKYDPVLEVKLDLNQTLNVLTAKLTFWYGPNSYPINHTNQTAKNRNYFFEKKLLHSITPYLDHYNPECDLYEIINHQKYLEFMKWVEKNKQNPNYDLKIAHHLTFKNKQKKQFQILKSKFKNDFLQLDWTIEGYETKDVINIIRAYQQKEKYVKLTTGRLINILNEIDFDQLQDELLYLNTNINNFANNQIQVAKNNTFYFVNNYQKQNKNLIQKYLANAIQDTSYCQTNIPNWFQKQLKNYQLHGYLWLKKMVFLKTGCILADEMGLGKTVQTIALLADLYTNQKIQRPTLIVCPSSLLYNWQKELQECAPKLAFQIIDGDQKQRQKLLANCANQQVVVTSYNLLNKDLNSYLQIPFYLQILDEAQKVKNHTTQFAKDVKKINAELRIALTGTPIENNLLELWAIFDFLMPHYLYDFKTFKAYFCDEKNEQHNQINLNRLKSKIDPFILRRTKAAVLQELPSKAVKVFSCELNDKQKELYWLELQKSQSEIKKYIQEQTLQQKSIFIFTLLMRLRQICCDPKLIDPQWKHKSAKFEMCLELIKDLVYNNNKILLFSQFTSMIELLADALDKMQINYCVLTGKTPTKQRMQLVNQFNNDANTKVFLIALKAGGVGLNLTSANTVIHYEPWWNESLENQAADRAHRIGQNQNITVYKLISKSTIEEKILALQTKKNAIINQIFDGLSSKQNLVDLQAILQLLEMD